jgi:hypothetical protein
MAKPNKKAPLGSGGRFAAGVKANEAKGEPASEAKAVMAIAGRKKYGGARMAAMSAAGRRGRRGS